MLTKIDLCSMALLKLGETPIQSLQDDGASAKLASTLFEPVIDSLLASHPWRFAISELSLTKNTDGEFLLPADVLRVLKSSSQIIGDKIHSDSDNITVTAVVRTLPEKFPSYFISLAATRLAMEFCVPLLGNQTIFRMLVALYESELQTAKFIDSTTCISSSIDNFSLINTRF